MQKFQKFNKTLSRDAAMQDMNMMRMRKMMRNQRPGMKQGREQVYQILNTENAPETNCKINQEVKLNKEQNRKQGTPEIKETRKILEYRTSQNGNSHNQNTKRER